MPFGIETIKRVLRDELLRVNRGLSQEYVGVEPDGSTFRDINKFFIGKAVEVATGKVLVGIDLTPYWKPDKIIMPHEFTHLRAYTRQVFRYPLLTYYAIYPTLLDKGLPPDSGIWVGLELGTGGPWGLAGFRYFIRLDGAEDFHAWVCSGSKAASVSILDMLPSDFQSNKYPYQIKLNKCNVEFYVGGKLVAVILHGARVSCISGPPYGINGMETRLPSAMPAFWEIITFGDVTLEFPMQTWNTKDHYLAFRVADGDPLPPRKYELYVTGTNTKFIGYSLSSGSITSHPIPTFGYGRKTIYFMADKDGELIIEVFLESRNWREYDRVSVTNNKLVVYNMADEAVLTRIIYTPNTYPATILEGEMIVN